MSTDYTAGVLAAINKAAAEGREVVLPAGRINCATQLVLTAGARIIGRGQKAILDFSNKAATTANIIAFGDLGAAVVTTGDVGFGTETIPAPGHGLQVGEWFRLISTINVNTSAAGPDRLGSRADTVYFTETFQVMGVPDANNITINGGVRFPYPAGSAVKKLNSINGLGFRELTIDNGNIERAMADFRLLREFVIEDVETIDPLGPIEVRGAVDRSRVTRYNAAARLDHGLSSLQFLKVRDGCMALAVEGCEMAGGGQMLDITYSPTPTTLGSTPIDTLVRKNIFRDSTIAGAAITDHPGVTGSGPIPAELRCAAHFPTLP